ncbi:MAG: ribonuclease VapC [Candidatus Bathyarchaeota archaeon]|nr:ribonuclease VapC [Candidatus Termiticorpusculum sp.]
MLRKKIVVLDTSAFLAGFDPFSLGEEQVTVPKVHDEIRTNSMAWVRFNTAIESGKVKIKMPHEEYSNKIKASASKVGDSYLLSETDMQLLALALELKIQGEHPEIITDDYSIQNVAKQNGIEFYALATFGIQRLLEWIRYCPACHKEYPVNSSFNACQICGTELKRKPKRTTRKAKA